RNEGVFAAAASGLEGAGGRGEVGGKGNPRHVSVAAGVHGDTEAVVDTTPAQVGGVDEEGAGGIELGHEGVFGAAEGGLEGAGGRGEVGGKGNPRHVGVAAGVHGDAEALVNVTPAEVGGVDEPSAGGIELGHEGVFGAADSGLEGAGGRGEVGGKGNPRHVGVAAGVHGDAEALVNATPAEVCRVAELSASGIELGHEGVFGAA